MRAFNDFYSFNEPEPESVAAKPARYPKAFQPTLWLPGRTGMALQREPRLLVPGQKPIGSVKVNYNNKYAPDAFWMPLRNLAKYHNKSNINQSMVLAPCAYYTASNGLYGITAPNSCDYRSAQIPTLDITYYGDTLPVTLMVHCVVIGGVGWSVPLGNRTNFNMSISTGSSGLLLSYEYEDYGWDSGITIPTGRPIFMVLHLASSFAMVGLRDAGSILTSVRNTARSNINGDVQWSLGGDGYTGRAFNGIVASGYVSRRVMTQMDIVALLSDPYQFLIPA
jgi:hypothetical protein